MLSKFFNKYFILTILVLLVTFYIYRIINNKVRISKLHYGIKANDLRRRLHVPIIDSYMKVDQPNQRSSGGRWVSEKELPESVDEIIHAWKIITPLTEEQGLYRESDAFRKKINDTLYYQLNIQSTIVHDSFAIRTGRLFNYNENSLFNLNLSDRGIDSIAKIWRLAYLIRK